MPLVIYFKVLQKLVPQNHINSAVGLQQSNRMYQSRKFADTKKYKVFVIKKLHYFVASQTGNKATSASPVSIKFIALLRLTRSEEKPRRATHKRLIQYQTFLPLSGKSQGQITHLFFFRIYSIFMVKYVSVFII